MTNATQVILHGEKELEQDQTQYEIIFLDDDGNELDLGTAGAAQTGATVLMTGYTSHAVGSVAAGDTVDVAIAKLEARIAVLESA